MKPTPTAKLTKSAGLENGSTDVRFRGLRLRQGFQSLRIKSPMPFIEWKRGFQPLETKYRIRMALLGRGTPADAQLLDMIQGVLDELKAS